MAQPLGLTPTDIEFGEATPEQRDVTWTLCAKSWADPISVDDYIERERHLADHELNRNGGCQYWVLFLKGYPRQVIASCETTRKPVLIADSQGRPARKGCGYSVTNAYTNPSYRRQGMAAFLLRRVKEQMDTDGGDFSVLYSDSGRSYYTGLGWAPFASRQATLTILPTPPSVSARSRSSSLTASETHSLRTSDLPELCAQDCDHLTKAFDALPLCNKTYIASLPTHAQITWHLDRAEFDARKLLPSTSSGAIANPALSIGAITPARTAWIYWSHDWRNKRLRVLRIARAGLDNGGATAEERVVAIAALLGAAVDEARRWGLSKVVVWNPEEEVRSGCKYTGNAQPHGVKVVFEERVEGLVPMLRWKEGQGVMGVKWERNDAYCWC